MANIGIEVISTFENVNKARNSKIIELVGMKQLGYSFAKRMLDNKHAIRFFKPDDQCEEIHLKDKSLNGSDDKYAEDVDLFIIGTHGNNKDSNAVILYDTKKDDWEGNSNTWRLGNVKLKWLMIWGCSTIDLNQPLGVWNIFENLHQFCGAYGNLTFMSMIASSEGRVISKSSNLRLFGDGVGEMLTDGHTVADAWLWGMNHFVETLQPGIVVCAEKKFTWNNGNPWWLFTTLNNDHLSGHGYTADNIPKTDKYWLSYQWIEPVITVSHGYQKTTGRRIGGPRGGRK